MTATTETELDLRTTAQRLLAERDVLHAENARLREALTAAMFALGRGGANVLGGPNRTEWEQARAALA